MTDPRLISRLLRRLAGFARDERGNIAMLFALALVPMMFIVGAMVDYSRGNDAKVRLQAALDAALLAGVQEADPARREAVALQMFTANWDGPTVRPTFTTNPDNTFSGTVVVPQPVQFGGITGRETLDVAASGTARLGRNTGTGCIILLDPRARQSLLVNSGADIIAPDCEIHVHSTARPAAIINAGTTLDVKRICIASDQIIKNTSANPPIELGCTPTPDPYDGAAAIAAPAVGACSNATQVMPTPPGGRHVLAPGVWCDAIFNGSPVIEFLPGLHVIKGRMIINAGATVTGNGVTFFFPDINSEMRVNGGITSNLSAPTAGPYAGILMFERKHPTQRAQYVFNGSRGEELRGVIYLPNRDATYNSVSTIRASNILMVFNTLIINNIDWRFAPNGGAAAGSGSNMPSLMY